MSMRKACRVAGVVALLLVVVARPADAQSGFEQIDRYTVDMQVANDGVLHVTETIEYDFGGNAKHGIYRYIPDRFHYDEKYDRVYPISGIRVSASSGTPTEVKITDDQNNKVIRIGDPDRTITGRHQYVIEYNVRGALNHFADHDELYWNAIGNRWDVAMRQVDVAVRTPVAITKIACFAGPERSNLPCAAAAGEGTAQASFHASELGPGSGLTVVAAVPPGVISGLGPILDERWSVQRAVRDDAGDGRDRRRPDRAHRPRCRTHAVASRPRPATSGWRRATTTTVRRSRQSRRVSAPG